MTESQLKQDLRAARALFSALEKWTQRAFARDENGYKIESISPDNGACQWCLGGALFLYDSTGEAYYEIARHIPIPLVMWNDAPERTFEDITTLLDKAIEDAP